MSKLDDIELNQKLAHSYGYGESLTQQLSQFPEAKQQIKDLLLELIGDMPTWNTTYEHQAVIDKRQIDELRQKVNEL